MKPLLSLLISLAFSINSYAGIQTNGGDGIAAEFLSILDETLQEISKTPKNTNDSFSKNILQDIKEHRDRVEIQTSPFLVLNNIPKDALNYPTLNPPLIRISQLSWARLTKYQKTLLVFHEILPISGYFDGDYKLSSSLISMTTTARDRIKEIESAFANCHPSKLKEINDHELERIRDERKVMLTQMTVKNLCVDGLRLLIQAGWDVNLCQPEDPDTLTMTPLAYLRIFYPRGFREHFSQFNEFNNLLIANGASNSCSGFYDKQKEE